MTPSRCPTAVRVQEKGHARKRSNVNKEMKVLNSLVYLKKFQSSVLGYLRQQSKKNAGKMSKHQITEGTVSC